MQYVQFIHGHHVNKLQYIFFTEEIPGYIQHHPPPGIKRGIFNIGTLNLPDLLFLPLLVINSRGQHLQHGLDAIKYTSLAATI
ncbi:hypothetical protein D3C87_1566440 [compost metagenome]